MYSDLTDNPVIDTHVHIFPQKLSDAIRHWFETHAWHFKYQGTVEELIQGQFSNGAVGLVLLCYAHRKGMSRDLNRFVSHMVGRFPNTKGLATIHPDDENPRDILKEAFDEWGLCGVKIHCHVQKIAPDDLRLYPIYGLLQESGGILNIHAGKEPAIDAYGMDVRAITGAERMERVLRRFPELKIIIPHLGFDESDKFYRLMDQFPNLYMDTTMVLGHFFQVTVDREKLIHYGDRILYGSDYPHIPYHMDREVKALLEMNLGRLVTEKILYRNAVELFQLEPRS
jgi:predicted TIM-barrel fold metal-dependent hydrolase